MVVANRLATGYPQESEYCVPLLLRINARFSGFWELVHRGGNILFLKEASVFNSPGF